ncbi:PIN domain-containing protein [uncultured Legionella sp.]|uniref:PIN domain-containing protein n=1 Tax=uncultured Legionella sp. TaxID=210934 RepID=UPI002612DD2E|nr:PIN domain-containing protein [uncultured Legionella sp.]
MDVFIDTNILTSLYRLSSEDLENFKKIYVLLESKEINILLTEQVKNEFFRIRDDIIYSPYAQHLAS